MTDFTRKRGRKPTPKDQLWERLDKSSACWTWTGKRYPTGYGRFGKHYAHRVAYELAYGPIPEGMHVCHSCDNPPCCNPAHLWIGTPKDNMQDRERKGRGKTKGQPASRATFTRAACSLGRICTVLNSASSSDIVRQIRNCSAEAAMKAIKDLADPESDEATQKRAARGAMRHRAAEGAYGQVTSRRRLGSIDDGGAPHCGGGGGVWGTSIWAAA